MTARFSRVLMLVFLTLGGALHLFAQPVTEWHNNEPGNVHKVTVGIFLNSLYDVDPASQSFLADFYVWTNHETGDLNPLETLVLPRSRNQTIITEWTKMVNGIQWSCRRYRSNFLYDWNIDSFPFDKHRLKIFLRDGLNQNNRVEYIPDTVNSGMSTRFDLPGWTITDFQIGAEDVTYDTTFGDPSASGPQTFRWIVGSFVMKRDATALFFKLLTGGYIAFAAAMLSCLMKTTQPPVFSGRMGVQIASLFAAIINNRATDSILGRVDAMTLPDMLHILIYVSIFCAMVITLRSRVLSETNREQQATKMERKSTLILVGCFLIANAVLIFRAALSPIQNA